MHYSVGSPPRAGSTLKVISTQEWDPSLSSSWKREVSSLPGDSNGADFSQSFGKTLQSLQSHSSQVAQAPQPTESSRHLATPARAELVSRNRDHEPSRPSASRSDNAKATGTQDSSVAKPKDTGAKPTCAKDVKSDEAPGDTDGAAQDPAAVSDPASVAVLLLVPQPATPTVDTPPAATVAAPFAPAVTQASAAPVELLPTSVTGPTDAAANPAKETFTASPTQMPANGQAMDANAKGAVAPTAQQATPSLPGVLPPGDQPDLENHSSIPQTAYSSSGQLVGIQSPAATTTVAAPAVSAHAVAETVAVEAARVGPGGKSEIVLRLDPPDLGSIKVQIQHDPNGLRIDVIPQKVHAAELLQSQVDSLRQRLENAGLGNVHVQIRQDQAATQQQQNQRQDAWEDVSLDSFSAGLKKVGSPWKATAFPGQSAVRLRTSVDFRA